MADPKAPRVPPAPLYKQKSWSPDSHREEAWLKRKSSHRLRSGRSKSVTDEDLDELKACFELGFGFDSPDRIDPKLSQAFPALEFFCAVNRQYSDRLSRSSSLSSTMSLDSETTSSFVASPSSILDPGDDPNKMKTKLKQWAQVVACSVRQSSPR
ncbi:unnamed protein product [Ilex paraguariensis]|uniref:Uncharacterized protein n=1 Tax=Ilex paraguariensis TaxID=185542 RepID=A0ABC8R7Q3_9AQUA